MWVRVRGLTLTLPVICQCVSRLSHCPFVANQAAVKKKTVQHSFQFEHNPFYIMTNAGMIEDIDTINYHYLSNLSSKNAFYFQVPNSTILKFLVSMSV